LLSYKMWMAKEKQAPKIGMIPHRSLARVAKLLGGGKTV